jgi:CspA family cold shock protein
MSSSTVSTPAVSSSSERFTGRVKWFNNKAGYGFITVTDGSKSGTDVFVHHSSIKVDSEQYKYLVQGEYVDFSLSDTKTDDHEFQAGEVCGIKGGKLMCETRRDSRAARSQYRSSRHEDNENSEPVKMPRSVSAPKEQKPQSQGQGQRPPRARGQGPREEGSEWTYVAKARKGTEPTQSTSQAPRASGGRGRGRPPRTGRGEGNSQSA